MKMPEPQPTTQPPTHSCNGMEFPRPTNYQLSVPTLTVEPLQLASWIVKNSSGPQPSVLLLDIRPRDVHSQGFIRHRWVAQIEPLVIKPNISSQKIEESMIMNPEVEQQMFARRHEYFDLIVYYDQRSTVLDKENQTLYHLRQAIYEFEFQKVLRNAPIMLIGGFDAWSMTIGQRGVYRYTDSSRPILPEKRGSDQRVPLSPVKVHHTLYDYFTYKGPSVSKESMVRNNKNHVETPPLRGIFAHTLSSLERETKLTMPIPQPVNQEKSQNASELTRRKTFIDNPFHGFTSTTNQQFDVPPAILRKKRPPVPSKEQTPPLPPKPSDINLPEYRAAPVSENSFSQMGNVAVGTTGLKNLGNTCYMNSIIQCLSGTIPFARYFISGVYKHHINMVSPLSSKGRLANEFAGLLRLMWGGNYSFISPVPFREALLEFAPQFRGSEQHDSQEFLNFLLDGLHEDCNLITEKPNIPSETAEEEALFEQLPDWKASTIAWDKYLLRNSSVVVSLFQGQYRSRLTCLTCHTTSTTYNSFMSLSLPIPTSRNGPTIMSIYQCLDYFVQDEILEGDNAWNCPRCKKPCRASKSLTLSKLPDVLLIHLKRFSVEGLFNNKLETMIDSPIRGLDLTKYVPATMFPPDQPPEKSMFNYDLYAVSNHYGSLTGGHYTACVRNGYRNEWHNFDDTRFSVCDESKIMSKAAYNLFYVRSTVK
ncbi:unnamed protein product [Rhizopus microsporus]